MFGVGFFFFGGLQTKVREQNNLISMRFKLNTFFFYTYLILLRFYKIYNINNCCQI